MKACYFSELFLIVNRLERDFNFKDNPRHFIVFFLKSAIKWHFKTSFESSIPLKCLRVSSILGCCSVCIIVIIIIIMQMGLF